MARKRQSRGAKLAAILPESSVERFLPYVQRAGYTISAPDARGAVTVVDLTAPEGMRTLNELRSRGAPPPHAGLAILAVIGDGPEEGAAALRAGADGFTAAARLENEFELRLERMRFLAEVRFEHARRERNLAVLLELAAEYASALDAASLLHDVTRRLADELSIDRCALVLLDEQRGMGHIVAASDDKAVRNVVIELSRYPEIREAVRTGQPVVVDDVGSHPLLDEVKDTVQGVGIRALAAVPLVVHTKTLGVLLLRASEGTFEPLEIQFAQTVAHATAIALRNARIVEGLRGQAEKAEAQVAELARYEEFFQYVSDGIAILDEAGSIVSINPAGAQILGVDPEKARGRPFVSFVRPINAAAMLELLLAVRKGLVLRNVDLDMQSGERPITTISVCASAVPNGPGVILSFRDVTDARSMERELRKTKEFLEKLINSSVDAIVASDMAGTVILYNQSAERMLGYPRDEVIGKLKVREIYPQGMAEQVATLLAPEHGGTGRLEPTRTEVIAKGGERVPVTMTAALILEGKTAVANVGVFSDLRERTRLEARLSRAQERLEEAEKQAVIVELAGTAAHELNQPLTSVMGYAELLKRKLKEDDPSWRPVDIIYREAERMAEIVRKIGKITRYETKAYVGNSRILDLDRAAGDDE